jgi:fused signal recognition particle receptor
MSSWSSASTAPARRPRSASCGQAATEGLSVMLAAGDTFRAAAIEQLKIWAERTARRSSPRGIGADAAGLAFDAFEGGEGGRLRRSDHRHRRPAAEQDRTDGGARKDRSRARQARSEAPHSVLQTVDATTGQNALNQVEIFRNVAGVNGLVMTKLDGTARGGILVAIAAKASACRSISSASANRSTTSNLSRRASFAKAIAGVA